MLEREGQYLTLVVAPLGHVHAGIAGVQTWKMKKDQRRPSDWDAMFKLATQNKRIFDQDIFGQRINSRGGRGSIDNSQGLLVDLWHLPGARPSFLVVPILASTICRILYPRLVCEGTLRAY